MSFQSLANGEVIKAFDGNAVLQQLRVLLPTGKRFGANYSKGIARRNKTGDWRALKPPLRKMDLMSPPGSFYFQRLFVYTNNLLPDRTTLSLNRWVSYKQNDI